MSYTEIIIQQEEIEIEIEKKKEEKSTNETDNSENKINQINQINQIIEKSKSTIDKVLQSTSDNIGKPFIEFSQKINSNFVKLFGL